MVLRDLPSGYEGPMLLVVEDNSSARNALTSLLRTAGYRVVAKADGEQALDVLRDGCRPDLILLDMLLPRLDGWDFLDALRQWSKPLQVPIVIMTGSCLSREWALVHGCHGFVRKPLEGEIVLQEVRSCLSHR
jgi:two-component system response regulator PfeR